MEVPDHDVVTRRKQFRSKKDKADRKKAKKDQKKAEKDEAKKKGDGKQKKKGRNAKEKLEDQKKTTEKTKKHLRAKDRAGENASHSSSKTPPASSDVPAPAASKVSPSKSSPTRKMKRLRRMSSAKASMGSKVWTDAEAIQGAELEEVEMHPQSNAEKKKKTKKKEEKTSKAGKTTRDTKKTKGQSSTQKASKASKGGKKNDKKDGNPEKKKGSGGTKRSRKVKEEFAVDQKVKDLVLKTLKECESSNCTHPSYVAAEVDGLENSIYWSRKAVGVKIDRNLLSNPKAKGKGKAQIAYFGGKTPCTYSNMVLAGLFVTRLGLANHMSISNHSIFDHRLLYFLYRPRYHLSLFTISFPSEI